MSMRALGSALLSSPLLPTSSGMKTLSHTALKNTLSVASRLSDAELLLPGPWANRSLLRRWRLHLQRQVKSVSR